MNLKVVHYVCIFYSVNNLFICTEYRSLMRVKIMKAKEMIRKEFIIINVFNSSIFIIILILFIFKQLY